MDCIKGSKVYTEKSHGLASMVVAVLIIRVFSAKAWRSKALSSSQLAPTTGTNVRHPTPADVAEYPPHQQDA